MKMLGIPAALGLLVGLAQLQPALTSSTRSPGVGKPAVSNATKGASRPSMRLVTVEAILGLPSPDDAPFPDPGSKSSPVPVGPARFGQGLNRVTGDGEGAGPCDAGDGSDVIELGFEGCFRHAAMGTLYRQSLPLRCDTSEPMHNSNYACRKVCKRKGYLMAATSGQTCACTNSYPSQVPVGDSFCRTFCPAASRPADGTSSCDSSSCCGFDNGSKDEQAWTVIGVGDIDSAYGLLRAVAQSSGVRSWNPTESFGTYTIEFCNPNTANDCYAISAGSEVKTTNSTVVQALAVARGPANGLDMASLWSIRQSGRTPGEYIIFRVQQGAYSYLATASDGTLTVSYNAPAMWTISTDDDGQHNVFRYDIATAGSMVGVVASDITVTGLRLGSTSAAKFKISRIESALAYSIGVDKKTPAVRRVKCTLDMAPDPFGPQQTYPVYSCVGTANSTVKAVVVRYMAESAFSPPENPSPAEGFPPVTCEPGVQAGVSRTVTTRSERTFSSTSGTDNSVTVGVDVGLTTSLEVTSSMLFLEATVGASLSVNIKSDYTHAWRSETSSSQAESSENSTTITFTATCDKNERKEAFFYQSPTTIELRVRNTYGYQGFVMVVDHANVNTAVQNHRLEELLPAKGAREFSTLSFYTWSKTAYFVSVTTKDLAGNVVRQEKELPGEANTTAPVTDPCVGPSGCNNGTCIADKDSRMGFKCVCQNGFSGTYCNIAHDFCGLEQPCKNGAPCANDLVNGYNCTCPYGFMGKDCGTILPKKYALESRPQNSVRFTNLRPGTSVNVKVCSSRNSRLNAFECLEDIGSLATNQFADLAMGTNVPNTHGTYSEQLVILTVANPALPGGRQTVATCIKALDRPVDSYVHVVYTPTDNTTSSFAININSAAESDLLQPAPIVLQTLQYQGINADVWSLSTSELSTLVPGAVLRTERIGKCGGFSRYVTYSTPEYLPPPGRILRFQADVGQYLSVFGCSSTGSTWNCNQPATSGRVAEIVGGSSLGPLDLPIPTTAEQLFFIEGRGAKDLVRSVVCVRSRQAPTDVSALVRWVPVSQPLPGGNSSLLVSVDREAFVNVSAPAPASSGAIAYTVHANPNYRSNRNPQQVNESLLAKARNAGVVISVGQVPKYGRQLVTVGSCSGISDFSVPERVADFQEVLGARPAGPLSIYQQHLPAPTRVRSLRDCQAACKASSACRAVLFHPDVADPAPNCLGYSYLKNTNTAALPSGNVATQTGILSFKTSPPPPPVNTAVWVVYDDYRPASSVRLAESAGMRTPEECATQCLANELCTGFEHHPLDGTGKCFLLTNSDSRKGAAFAPTVATYWYRIDVNECSSGAHRCAPTATCTNTVVSYKCTCNSGYTGDGAVCTVLPSGPDYIGCYRDQGQRHLPFMAAAGDNSMTNDKCRNLCRDRGFQYAGTEVGSECFCGNTIGAYEILPPTSCGFTCAGDSKQACGGPWALTVFATGLDAAAMIKPVPLGCFRDAEDRDLPERPIASGDMTAEKCAANCRGFPYFGMQVGGECKCGNKFNRYGQAPDSECVSRCSGNNAQQCGGPWRNTVYANPPSTPKYLGCFKDSSDRDLPEKIIFDGAMTLEKCQANCNGYLYYGTQAINWCLCGNSYGKHGQAPESECSNQCSGNSGQKCGQGWRNSVYQRVPKYLGCFKDSNDRDLPEKIIGDGSMTLEKCQANCNGYRYFGTQAGTWCLCGNSYGKHGQAAESECASHCVGNSGQKCGWGWRNSLYQSY